MAELSDRGLKPAPVFEEPWHADLFALTVHLNEAGQFSWADWASRFGATLARCGQSADLNGGNDYFGAWLETLESFLVDLGATDFAAMQSVRKDWEHAYLSTPHGQPVKIE